MSQVTQSRPAILPRLRNAFYFRPLAVILAWLLILPPAAWITGSQQWQAKAQVTSVPVWQCGNVPSYAIFQNLCFQGLSFVGDMYQLESDSVAQYLTVHGQPLSEYATIYSLGRNDLRSGIRATILGNILGIITRAPNAANGDYGNLSQHEIDVYNFFVHAVQQNEIALYQYAENDKNNYLANPCTWSPDPQIAQVYGLVYDTSTFCNQFSPFVGATPPVPSVSYFLSSALKNSAYGQNVSGTGGSQDLAYTLGLVTTELAGIISVAALVVPGALAAATAATAAGAALATPSIIAAAGAIGLGTGLTISAAFLPLLMLIVGIIIVIDLVNYQNQINALSAIDTDLANAKSQPPNLYSFMNDSTGTGMLKLSSTLVGLTLPEQASSLPIPQHQATDNGFFITGPSGPPTNTTQFTYQGCDGNAWTASTHNGWWVQTSTQNGQTVSSITGDICVLTSPGSGTGVQQTIGLRGSSYIVTLLAPPSGASPCPADPLTGFTNPPNNSLASCSSYVENAFQYIDPNNNLFQNQIDPGPKFLTPPGYIYAIQASTGNGGIAISASDGAAISLAAGTLPQGFSFTPGNGTAKLSWDGTEQAGTFNITLRAQGTGGVATQVFTVKVVAAPVYYTSPNSATFTIGVPASFTVSVAGTLPITIGAAPPTIPAGMTFVDNGNGTATLSGTPALNAVGCNKTTIKGCGFNATQTKSNFGAFQQFTVTINPAPAAQYSGPASAEFVQGVPSYFFFSAQGALTHVSWSATGLPAGVTFADNGDGTATLFATSSTLAGTYPISVEYQTYGAASSASPATINFTLKIVGSPAFTSQNYYTCTASSSGTSPCSFPITTNQSANTGPHISLAGPLPAGDTFTDNGNGTATVSGNIGPGTGGFYPLTLTASSSQGTGTQQFSLHVNQAPTFFSPATTAFTLGQPNAFNVIVNGFPLTPEGSGPGTIPNSTGMVLGIEGSGGLLPSWLHFAAGSSGAAVLSGTPPTGSQGNYTLFLSALNQVGTPVTQTFTLEVVAPGAMRIPTALTGSQGPGDSGAWNFGASVALSGDGGTAVIGAPHDSGAFGAGLILTGSANTGWREVADLNSQLLTNSSATDTQMVGASVAVSNDGHTALFGAPQYNSGTGAAWIFGNGSTGNWTQLADPLTVSTAAGAQQGASVAVSGNGSVALVGAPQFDRASGIVYIYEPSFGTYSLFDSLAVAGVPNAQFGASVAITPDGNTIIVGEPTFNSGTGAARIYTRSSTTGTWFIDVQLAPGGETGNANFGAAVGISGDGQTAIVGGPADNSNAGAFWIFTRSGSQWTQQGNKLTVSDATGNSKLGSSVALSQDGNTAVVGGPADDTPESSSAGVGATWIFRRTNGVWSQQLGKIVGGGVGNAQQGTSVAISSDGNTALTGGPLNNSGAGAAWVLGSAQINTTLSHLPPLTTGQAGAYTINLTNVGSLSTSGGVFLSASLPSNVSVAGFTGPANWSCSISPPGCSTAAGMFPGATAQFTLSGTGKSVGAVHTTVTATTQELITANSTASDSSSVSKGTSVLTWPAPASLTYGSALGPGQLNATANVPGTFVYTPPAGTVLPVGNNQQLSVTFTPTDATDYASVSAHNTISVLPSSSAGAANLVLTTQLSRSNPNLVLLTLTVANTGGAAAQNVKLTTAELLGTPGSTLPESLGTIPAGQSVQATVSFALSSAKSGTSGTLSLSGTYTGGTFSSGSRVVLP